LQDAFRILYRSGLAPARAVERIREELPGTGPIRLLLDFIAGATRHGIVGPFERWSGEVPPQAPPDLPGVLDRSGAED